MSPQSAPELRPKSAASSPPPTPGPGVPTSGPAAIPTPRRSSRHHTVAFTAVEDPTGRVSERVTPPQPRWTRSATERSAPPQSSPPSSSPAASARRSPGLVTVLTELAAWETQHDGAIMEHVVECTHGRAKRYKILIQLAQTDLKMDPPVVEAPKRPPWVNRGHAWPPPTASNCVVSSARMA